MGGSLLYPAWWDCVWYGGHGKSFLKVSKYGERGNGRNEKKSHVSHPVCSSPRFLTAPALAVASGDGCCAAFGLFLFICSAHPVSDRRDPARASRALPLLVLKDRCRRSRVRIHPLLCASRGGRIAFRILVMGIDAVPGRIGEGQMSTVAGLPCFRGSGRQLMPALEIFKRPDRYAYQSSGSIYPISYPLDTTFLPVEVSGVRLTDTNPT
jgi:hypothetical protein